MVGGGRELEHPPRRYELDLTSFLQQQKAAGSTSVTGVLKAAGREWGDNLFASDEAVNRPQLVVSEGRQSK